MCDTLEFGKHARGDAVCAVGRELREVVVNGFEVGLQECVGLLSHFLKIVWQPLAATYSRLREVAAAVVVDVATAVAVVGMRRVRGTKAVALCGPVCKQACVRV